MPYSADEKVDYSDTFKAYLTYTPSEEDEYSIFFAISWPDPDPSFQSDANPDDVAVAFQALIDELPLLPSFDSGSGVRTRRYTSTATPTEEV